MTDRPSAGRRLVGLAVGLLSLLCVAFPLGWTALFAYASFGGCFLTCGAPEPGVGLVWSAVTALLLAVPVTAGMAVARVRSRRAWLSAAALVLLAVAGWDLLALTA